MTCHVMADDSKGMRFVCFVATHVYCSEYHSNAQSHHTAPPYSIDRSTAPDTVSISYSSLPVAYNPIVTCVYQQLAFYLYQIYYAIVAWRVSVHFRLLGEPRRQFACPSWQTLRNTTGRINCTSLHSSIYRMRTGTFLPAWLLSLSQPLPLQYLRR